MKFEESSEAPASRLHAHPQKYIHAPWMGAVIGLERGGHGVGRDVHAEAGFGVSDLRDVARVAGRVSLDPESAPGRARERSFQRGLVRE